MKTKRIKALVRPELLKWAREDAGLSESDAAKKASTKIERLLDWEAGEDRPTIRQLRLLANAYKRPIAVFYLPEPPKGFQAMRDYRRLPGEVAGKESALVRLEVRKARYRRQIALDLLSDLGEGPGAFTLKASLSEDPEAVATRARAALNISREDQRSWKAPYEAFHRWRAAIENLGILVFQVMGIEVSELRGFSLFEEPLPILVVNTKDHPHGIVFTLLHELAHLMLRREGLCDLVEEAHRPPEEQEVEVFCNHVAGAIAIPANTLLRMDLVRSRRVERWTSEELRGAATELRVSRVALLRRLLILGKTTRSHYQARCEEIDEEHRRREKPKKKGGFAPPNIKAVSTAGPSFVRLVLEGLYQEKITSSAASDYLEVKLKWIPKIEEAVFGESKDILAVA